VRSYRAIIERYIKEFGDGPVDQVTPEQISTFLNRLTYSNMPPMQNFVKVGHKPKLTFLTHPLPKQIEYFNDS
jgi:hypothetical protein